MCVRVFTFESHLGNVTYHFRDVTVDANTYHVLRKTILIYSSLQESSTDIRLPYLGTLSKNWESMSYSAVIPTSSSEGSSEQGNNQIGAQFL